MPTPKIRIAKLDNETIEKIQAMEEELGYSIVALEPYYLPASLTADQISGLKSLEQELGVVLLAYKK
jgi:hypothetical protein